MELLIVLLACYGLYSVWKRIILPRLRSLPVTQDRGLLAVKAAMYLLMTEQGETSEEANAALSIYNSDTIPIFVITTAQDFIALKYNGQQLPMITDARNRGFTG